METGYQEDIGEEISRRRMVIILTMIGIPVFLILLVQGSKQGSPVMMGIDLICALVCMINLYYVRFKGFSIVLTRLTLAGLTGAAVYYILADLAPSSLLFMLVLPLVFTSVLGRDEGLAWNIILGAISFSLVHFAEQFSLASITNMAVDFSTTYVFICAFAWGHENIRKSTISRANLEHERLNREIRIKNLAEAKNKRLFEDLTEALHDVRELSGLIPICASCKKIRGDEDFWENVEAYLKKRTKLTFSHGFCPTCTDDAMNKLNQVTTEVTCAH